MRLLLAEDHEEIVIFVRKGLQYDNFVVDVAYDGQTALEKIMVNDYDILIIDLLLPKVDGIELVKKIREKRNNTPILVLTAIQDADTKAELLNLGADDYLEKPFSFRELLARIYAILRRVRGMPKKEIIQLGDLTLNPVTREVLRGSKKIKLRNKEFILLEYLMCNAGKVVNRTTLLEQVWDFNANVFSNTVETHISILRRKIDHGYDKKLLKTVHGVGYKISEEEE